MISLWKYLVWPVILVGMSILAPSAIPLSFSLVSGAAYFAFSVLRDKTQEGN